MGDVLWCGEELWVMSYGVVRNSITISFVYLQE